MPGWISGLRWSPAPVDPFVADLLARIDVAVTPYFK